MSDKKYEKPLYIDMDFNEAIERFSTTNPKELRNKMSERLDGLIHESDLTLPALRILAKAPDGFLETTDLIEELEALFKPDGKDAEIIEGRNDSHFSQKVRNIISHRESANNPIAKGWIDYMKEAKGLKITKAGLGVLASFS